MKSHLLTKSFLSLVFMVLIVQAPLFGRVLSAQSEADIVEVKSNSIEYNHLIIKNIPKSIDDKKVYEASDLKIEPLSMIEENIARNLDSQWAWGENTLDMIDSYSPFLFRTKKSAAYDKVKVLLQVNAKGKLSGFEILGEVDKGMKERIDYVIRKLPDCKPVPGYAEYAAQTFELIINK